MNAPARIEVRSEGISLAWEDGSSTLLDAATLRAGCPCAACSGAPPAGVGAVISSASIVGDYALGIVFGPDGHATGIFPYDLLRELGSAA
jgi:DUF971 family protein